MIHNPTLYAKGYKIALKQIFIFLTECIVDYLIICSGEISEGIDQNSSPVLTDTLKHNQIRSLLKNISKASAHYIVWSWQAVGGLH